MQRPRYAPQAFVDSTFAALRSKVSEECCDSHRQLLIWLAAESGLWLLHGLWSFRLNSRPVALVGMAIFLAIRWKIYGEPLLAKPGLITKTQVDALIPYLWTFYLVQIGQLVESYALTPVDQYLHNQPMEQNRALGRGTLRWFILTAYYAVKVALIVSKVQCFRHAHMARAKTHAL